MKTNEKTSASGPAQSCVLSASGPAQNCVLSASGPAQNCVLSCYHLGCCGWFVSSIATWLAGKTCSRNRLCEWNIKLTHSILSICTHLFPVYFDLFPVYFTIMFQLVVGLCMFYVLCLCVCLPNPASLPESSNRLRCELAFITITNGKAQMSDTAGPSYNHIKCCFHLHKFDGLIS